PVRVGDHCKFGAFQGTVEDIGLRSTRVRTPDRTVVTIPNADLATMPLENFGARDRFRLAVTLGVRYGTTPDQLRWLLVELKKLLLSHPKLPPERTRVRLVHISSSTLDIEVFAYIATRDEDEFLAVREDLFLRILDVMAAAGTGLSYRRAYNAQDEAADA